MPLCEGLGVRVSSFVTAQVSSSTKHGISRSATPGPATDGSCQAGLGNLDITGCTRLRFSGRGIGVQGKGKQNLQLRVQRPRRIVDGNRRGKQPDATTTNSLVTLLTRKDL